MLIILVVGSLFVALFGGIRLLAQAGERWRDRDEGGVDTGETFADCVGWDPIGELDRVHRTCVGSLDDLVLKALHQLLPEPAERDWFHVRTGEYHLVGVA